MQRPKRISKDSKLNKEIPTRPRRPTSLQMLATGLLSNGRSRTVVVGDADLLGKAGQVRKRRWLILFQILLMSVLVGQFALFYQYIRKPEPLPEMLPAVINLNFPPHYTFSIYEVDRPVSVAVSPNGERVYVAEMGGERMIKMFNQEGDLLGAFAPPRTATPERAPVYLAVSRDGRVFASDRAQHVIFIYDEQGNYLNTILSPTLTLSEYVAKHVGGLTPGMTYAYNIFEQSVYYQRPGETEQNLPAPDFVDWAPLGVRFDGGGRLLFTDVAEDVSKVNIFPESEFAQSKLGDFEPSGTQFGEFGEESGQMMFPNTPVVDSAGRIFISDSNNSRISAWDSEGNFLYNFGRGTGDQALSLPRGIAVDDHDRLYVVDAVGQSVKVYNASEDQVSYLFSFGEFGVGDGEFNFPNDIALDITGRLYIVDRENNRVQVWLY